MKRLARSVFLLGALTSSAAAAEPAAPAPTAPQCIEAADRGQQSREAGKLVASRSTFITCASTSCPAVVRKQCSEWLAEVEKQIPTVNFVAKDANGGELVDVEVTVDDRIVATKLDGRAVQVDPGRHVVRFRPANGPASADTPMTFRSGEKDRLVELKVAGPAPIAAKPPEAAPIAPVPTVDKAATATPKSGLQIPVLAWVGLGAAVVGTGTLVTFAALANDRESELRRTCAPSCPESDKDSLRTEVALGNVGLGLALTGLAVTVVSTILANRSSSPRTTGIIVTPRAASFGASF